MTPKPEILIFDVPDRRSLPVTGLMGKEYNFHFLIPIRKGFWFQPLVEMVLRIMKPRYTRSIKFALFDDEKELLKHLIGWLKNHQADLVLAFSERSTAILCENATELRSYTHIPFGNFDDFNTLNDKYAILEVCRRARVPTPKFVKIDDFADLKNATKLGFPLVLKCRLASGVNEAFRICTSKAEMEIAFKELHEKAASYSFFPCDRLVAEEFIQGRIFDGGFAVADGRVCAAITQERVWTIPPSGGFGAKNITREIPELIEYAQRIFKEVHWSGPAQLEFIRDEKDSQYKLIEINPRFWGTLALSFKAGANISESVIRSGLGEQLNSEMCISKEGVEFEWLLQETLSAEKMCKESKGALARHLKKIFSREFNNFSYSTSTNLLLAIPHLMFFFSSSDKMRQRPSLAKRLFE